jgi:hypothetical protein
MGLAFDTKFSHHRHEIRRIAIGISQIVLVDEEVRGQMKKPND